MSTPSSATTHWDVIVVGAGACGLTIAQRLREAGASVLVLDKGSRPGGRIAARRIGGAPVDTAARDIRVPDAVARREISRRTGAEFTGDHWVFGRPASAIGADWATGLDVRSTFVTAVERTGDCWSVVTHGAGQRFAARRVVLTAPAPQSAAMISAGRMPVPPALAPIEYSPRTVLLLALAGLPARATAAGAAAPTPTPGLPPAASPPVFDEIRFAPAGAGHPPSAELFASAAFSAATTADDATITQSRLLAEAVRLYPDARILDSFLHRWRYATATRTHPGTTVEVAPGLLVAGDGFGAAGEHAVQRAVLSGIDTAALLS